MPRLKPSALLLGLYIPILLLGLLLPRKASLEAGSMGIIKRIAHEILYLTGPAEMVLNVLLFVPFFFALLYLAPKLSRLGAALISCLTSAAAELAQSQIPERVSSWLDFFSNCFGVVIASVVVSKLSKKRSLS